MSANPLFCADFFLAPTGWLPHTRCVDFGIDPTLTRDATLRGTSRAHLGNHRVYMLWPKMDARLAAKPLARGFTLIEIAIVLVVIGVLLSGGLLAITPVVQGAKVSETRQKIATVETALLGYVIQNGCLPCPAATGSTTTGQAQFGATTYTSGCNTGTCFGTVAGVGIVPWVTLGINEGDTIDAWGNRLTYGVSPALTVSSSVQRSSSDGSFPSFTSAIAMLTNAAVAIPGFNRIAYVVLSHGRDGFAAESTTGSSLTTGNASAVQTENNRANLTFAYGSEVTLSPATYFDDIVSFKSLQPLILSCGSGSCGNPS
jgi:prepilin-type N-terminal cleavage/methylation domain-containing protein